MTMTNPAIQEARLPEFTVNDKLRKSRQFAGLSREDLAEAIGVSPRSIVRYENDGNVPKSIVLLYAMKTQVPAEWIDPERCTPSDLNREPTDYAFGEAPIAAFIVGPWGPSIVLEEAA